MDSPSRDILLLWVRWFGSASVCDGEKQNDVCHCFQDLYGHAPTPYTALPLNPKLATSTHPWGYWYRNPWGLLGKARPDRHDCLLRNKQITGQSFPGSACGHGGHVWGASTSEISGTSGVQSANWWQAGMTFHGTCKSLWNAPQNGWFLWKFCIEINKRM